MLPPSAPGGRHILVVDDLPEIGEFFVALLRRMREHDVTLTAVHDSERALRLVKERPFDIVVSDFRMPNADGIELLQTARVANPRGYRILMTGYNEIPADMSRIRAAAVDAYVQKPLRSQDIILLLFDFLHHNERSIAAFREDAREMEMMGAHEAA